MSVYILLKLSVYMKQVRIESTASIPSLWYKLFLPLHHNQLLTFCCPLNIEDNLVPKIRALPTLIHGRLWVGPWPAKYPRVILKKRLLTFHVSRYHIYNLLDVIYAYIITSLAIFTFTQNMLKYIESKY